MENGAGELELKSFRRLLKLVEPALVLPNLLKEDLNILFIGINPGLRSAETGHHFAGRSNRFWKFLYESGLTPVKLEPTQDSQLLTLGFGITNIVPRATAAAAELTTDELKEGAIILKNILLEYRPKVAAYLGKVIYQYLAGQNKCTWGIQENSIIPGVTDYVMPNPSGLNRMPIPEQLEYYRRLKRIFSN